MQGSRELSNPCRLQKTSVMYPWDKRTLFLGRLPDPVYASYGAATVVVSLGDSIRCSSNLYQGRGHSFLIPAGCPVFIDTGNSAVAICHLDVMGEDYASLTHGRRLPAGTLLLDVAEVADMKRAFVQMHQQPSDSNQAYQVLDDLLSYCSRSISFTPKTDERLVPVISLIKDRIQDNLAIEELASTARLSVPRLVQLFKMQTGVPLRRFRLWHRIYESVISISEGQNLTDTAMACGFSDSPHLTHSFSSMWGVTPSRLFGKGIGTEIIPPVKPTPEHTVNPHGG